ncbi:hypothetical protein B7494_g912 [Chlorociboria aeruginascens]|nr:hypothetical protein B7494_g912 [Chlorociboria aeruginascens]
MSSRFTFPHAYDAHMHREEILTLSRVASQKSVPTPDSNTPQVMATPTNISKNSKPQKTPQRRHFVFADPVAFRWDNMSQPDERFTNPKSHRYLEEDPSTVVIERRGRLEGYELYLVEQWACSRVHPTFVITTYTGDPSHSVLVGVLGVPADETSWSPRLRVYFKAISQYHARQKETPLGVFMVTNLSSFPSALTVIPVPDGDVRKHREDFIVNENLKRLGCSGRSGMSLATPAGATQAKFFQLYKTSDRIPLYGAVLELVKLCQVALMIFGRLEQEYADGLLCDVTEQAINDWWTEIGSEYYNIEPTDGILGPTTVAALLGMLMGARNRLNYYGAPVPKDSFDVLSLKRGIAYFQKSQKIDRTRRLDRHTLDRLHRVTAKAAAGEGWAVPKAVKSTVVELSGKGGEMVMGMVGGRDKAGIGEIETLDIDRFVSLVHGQRSKWLWYGKTRRAGPGESFGKSDPDTSTLTFTKDDQGGYIWSHSRSESVLPDEETDIRKKDSPTTIYTNRPPGSATTVVESPSERDQQLRKTVFKSVTGKMSDARSGFGRIKDAVGFLGHTSRHSKDDTTELEGRMEGYFSPNSAVSLAPSSGIPGSPTMVSKTFSWKKKPDEYQNGFPNPKDPLSAVPSADAQDPEGDSRLSLSSPAAGTLADEVQKENEVESQWAAQVRSIRRQLVVNDPSVAGSGSGDGDLEGPLLEAEREPRNFQVLLHRRHSIPTITVPGKSHRNEAWWPRQMSFSDAEDAVLTWDMIGVTDDDGDETDDWVTLQKQKYIAEDFRYLYEKILELRDEIGPWVESKIDGVDTLDELAARNQEEFQTLYYQLSESYQAVKQNSQDILCDERSHITEAIKDIEVLGAKLEYEINALISKVQDVEDGVSQFERQVDGLENRADELALQLETESWPHYIVRSITGIGTGPNITARRPT